MAAQTQSMITPPFVYTPPARSRTSSPVASTGFIPLSPPTGGVRSNTTSPVNCPSTPPVANGVRVYEQNFLLQFQNQEPNEHIRSIFQAKHPCLRVFKGCKFADRCFFRDLPQEWCVLCLLGEEHDKCKGTKPDTHPCMRVWGSCKYEDKCVFRPYPRVWCLFCLRGASHTKCSGIQPKKMPIIPKEVTSQCAEHERRVGGRPGSTTPPPRTPDREKERDRTRTPPPRGGFNGLPLSAASLGVSPMGSPLPSPSHSNCPSPLPLDAFAVLRTIQEVAPMLPSPSQSQPADLPNRADAPFVPGKTDNLDTIQRCARKVKGVLNKLTPEKYSRLMDQLLELLTEYVVTENLEGMMDALANQVFEKATTELMHVPLYARLSRELEGRLSSLQEPHVWGRDGARKYRVALLKRCHGLFYAAIPDDEGERERHRSRSCANTRFVGELYNCQAIPDRIIEEIANNLLWTDSDRPLGPRLELLISLIETCGHSFQERNGQRPDRQRVLASWFDKLKQLRSTTEPRIQFMIDNVVDLRENGWTSAHKEVPKTLAEAEQDYYQSVINHTKVRTRSPVLRRALFSPPRSPEVSPRMMSAA